MKVVVNLYDFLPPRDGMWCLKFNGIEIRCVGDHKYTYSMDEDSIIWGSSAQNELNVTLVPLLRTHFSRKLLFEGEGVQVLLKREKESHQKTSR